MTEHANLIATIAAAQQISPELLAAQVLVESSGQADAFRFEPAFYQRYVKRNPMAKAAKFGPLAACSFGLLQIMLEVAVEIGFLGEPYELFDPATGLDWGARHLSSLLSWAGGDYTRALCAYNGGKAAAITPPYRTQAYADRVFAAAKGL